MLKIQDSTGKTVGVLKDDDVAPTMHKKDCPCNKGKLLNCSCEKDQKEKEYKDAKTANIR